MMILRSLKRQPSHGYALVQHIRRASDDVLCIEEGSLYPALYRLEEQGLLASEWGVSENNRRAKFYRVTRAGERRLQQETDGWNRLAAGVAFVLRANPERA